MNTSWSQKLLLFVALSLNVVLLSCSGSSGGGTTGTGGGSFGIAGTLKTAGNLPVAGVQVSVVQQGAKIVSARLDVTQSQGKVISNDVTDDQGNFMLELEQRPSTVTLRFSSDTFDADVEVTEIPATATGVTLGLIYDEANESVNEESEAFEEGEHSSND